MFPSRCSDLPSVKDDEVEVSYLYHLIYSGFIAFTAVGLIEFYLAGRKCQICLQFLCGR